MTETMTTEKTTTEAPQTAPEPKKAPSRDELRAEGWSADEISRAEKRGLIPKEDAKPEPAKEPDAAAPATPEAGKPEEKPVEAKPKVSLPDFTLSPEQEAKFGEFFGQGTNVRGLYFRMKNERQGRQASDKRAQALEAELKTLKEQLASGLKGPNPDVPEGEDPEEKPLTLKQLRELQRLEAEDLQRKQSENQERSSTLASAQREHEEFARAQYQDFDATAGLALDLINNLESLVPDRKRQAKILNLVREMQVKAAQADQLGLDDYNATDIAYELGQLHPKYGQPKGEPKATGPSKETPKAPGSLTPEQLKRIEENTQRRQSSAAVPSGGGKRVMSPEDVDAATFSGWPYAKRKEFRDKNPEAYARLMRG